MSNAERVNQYRTSLITWDEMQSLLRANGCQMTKITAYGEHRLLPVKATY